MFFAIRTSNGRFHAFVGSGGGYTAVRAIVDTFEDGYAVGYITKVFATLVHTHPMEQITGLVAAMSNKAASSDTMMHRALTSAERNAPYSKSYISLAGPTEAFGPYPNFWSISYTFFDANNGVQEITGVTTRDKYYRAFSNGTISEWLLQATATPPQEYDLPLAAGFTASGGCKYFKTQDGVVAVAGEIRKEVAGITGFTTLATLPAGYRPTYNFTAPATSYPGTDSVVVMVGMGGAIQIAASLANAKSIYVCFSFVAAS